MQTDQACEGQNGTAQDCAKDIDRICVCGKLSGSAKDVGVTKSKRGKRLTACV